MKIVRLYTGEDGESHFEDIDIPLEDTTGHGHISRALNRKPRKSVFITLE